MKKDTDTITLTMSYDVRKFLFRQVTYAQLAEKDFELSHFNGDNDNWDLIKEEFIEYSFEEVKVDEKQQVLFDDWIKGKE